MGQLTPQEELLARRGTYPVTNTTAITNVPHYGFQATEDTVISEWKTYDAVGNEYDIVDKLGLSGITITTDMPAKIVPPEMRKANKHVFQLASGAGELLKKTL